MGKLETTIKQFEETNYCFKTLSRGGAPPLNKVLKTENKYFEGRKTIFLRPCQEKRHLLWGEIRGDENGVWRGRLQK